MGLTGSKLKKSTLPNLKGTLMEVRVKRIKDDVEFPSLKKNPRYPVREKSLRSRNEF